MSDVKQQIKKVIIIAIVIYVSFLLQMGVFSRLRLAGVTPNVIICIVSTYGFMKAWPHYPAGDSVGHRG